MVNAIEPSHCRTAIAYRSASSARAAAARSSNTSMLRAPSARAVAAPVPVRTRIARAPTASAASTSLIRSPTNGTPIERDAEIALESAQQRGLRLAAVAALVRMVRAVVDARELAARVAHRGVHPSVNRFERLLGEQPATDARLVRDDRDAESGASQRRDRLEAARDRPPFCDRLDELAGVLVDDAVAVQDDEPRRRVIARGRVSRRGSSRARRHRRALARSCRARAPSPSRRSTCRRRP